MNDLTKEREALIADLRRLRRELELEFHVDVLDRAIAALSQPATVAVPPGMKLVPVEPTREMTEDGAQRLVSWEDGCTWPDSWSGLQVAAARNEAERVWRSMWLAATPPTEQPAAGAVVDPTQVICPNCAHQFRAIPQDVQRLMLDAGFEPPFTQPAEPTPEQRPAEPFAYIHKRGTDEEEFVHAEAVNGPCLECEPLFLGAAPATAPLADERIIDLFNESCREHFNGIERMRHFARAIERAHGIGAASKGDKS